MPADNSPSVLYWFELFLLFAALIAVGLALLVIREYIRMKMPLLNKLLLMAAQSNTPYDSDNRNRQSNISEPIPIDNTKSDPLRKYMGCVEQVNQEIMFYHLTPDEASRKVADRTGFYAGEIYKAWLRYGN